MQFGLDWLRFTAITLALCTSQAASFAVGVIATQAVERHEDEPDHETPAPQLRTLRGLILPAQELTVRAGVDARLQEMLVQVGDTVTDGQELAHLDFGTMEREREKALAQRDRATAELAILESTIDQLSGVRQDLDDRIQQGEKILDNLDEPERSVHQTGSGSKSLMLAPVREAEKRRMSNVLGRAKRERARVHMEHTRLLGLRRALEDGAAAARVAVKTAEEVISQHAAVISPGPGTVSECMSRPSEFVAAGQALLKIIRTDHVRALLWIPPALRTRINLGQEAQIRQDDADDRWIPGEVARISALPDPRSGQYMAEIEIENPGGSQQLRPGLHIEGRVVCDK